MAANNITIYLRVFLLTLAAWGLPAHANRLQLDTEHAAVQLTPYYQLFVDNTGKTTIDDILTPDSPVLFSELPEHNANLGYHKEVHWFKVEIDNPTPHDINQLLEFSYPLLDQISLYLVNRNSHRILASYTSGDTRPFYSRLYPHPNFIFPLTFPAYNDTDLYVRIKTRGNLTANATLWQPDMFPEHARLQFVVLTLYFGLLLGLISYNFLLFLLIKEKSYFYYVLFATSMLLATGAFNGIWFEWFWPDAPQWHNLSVPIFFSLAGLFAALFSKSLLQTDQHAPKFNLIFNLLALVFLVLALIPYVLPLFSIAQLLTATALLLALTALFSGTYLSLKGVPLAQTYLVAWLFLIIGTLLFVARNFGWLSDTLFTRYGLLAGSALEMVLLAFTLAQRINSLKQTTHESRQETMQAETKLIEVLRNSERELIARVKKRTEELEKANSKLRQQEEELKKLAHFDALTGLANRTLIDQQLSVLLAHCKRDKIKLAVLFLDLDGFKAINDQYGHKIGDQLLQVIAGKLQDNLRDSDLIGRLGGDEFIVVIQEQNGEFSPEKVADKIKRSLAQRIVIDGFSLRIGVSIGIAVYPDNGLTIDTLLSVSDTEMYTDKQLRKNNFNRQ